ncbi:MAG: phosphoribosylglycinamide formyltransferase [Candidatus Omnitrophica bacterium]|nr:phosphoribosylglycinamide formyltransferase [Candidatus Omnitrophota bacterium]
MKKLAIFVSGNGTNMENLLCRIREGKVRAEASLVVSDNPGAYALERAKKFGVESVVVDRKKFDSKENFEAEIQRRLAAKKIDYVILAGFMRILSPSFVRAYRDRILNIHPALLPDFPGAHAIQEAWEAKVRKTGVTVHFVDEGVDTGPVILQREVAVEANDTLESLEKKIHAVEYEIYPEAINLVLKGEVK